MTGDNTGYPFDSQETFRGFLATGVAFRFLDVPFDFLLALAMMSSEREYYLDLAVQRDMPGR
jgi:hypothetical protein